MILTTQQTGVTVKNTIRRSEIQQLMGNRPDLKVHSGKESEQLHKYLVLILFLGEDVSYERVLNFFLFDQIVPQPSDGQSRAPARPGNQKNHKTLIMHPNYNYAPNAKIQEAHCQK